MSLLSFFPILPCNTIKKDVVLRYFFIISLPYFISLILFLMVREKKSGEKELDKDEHYSDAYRRLEEPWSGVVIS